jgi:hypothetical protein
MSARKAERRWLTASEMAEEEATAETILSLGFHLKRGDLEARYRCKCTGKMWAHFADISRSRWLDEIEVVWALARPA